MTRFIPSREWEGQTVIIVGGGESVNAAQIRLIGMARSKDLVRVIAINDAVYLCWFADIVYACDAKWWRHHGNLPRFSGRKLRLQIIGDQGRDLNEVDVDVDFVSRSGLVGFDDNPGYIRSAGNSGYQVVHLSAHLGVKRQILVGFDMKGRHWFGDHPEGVASRTQLFSNRCREFADLAKALADRGITVVNASPISELTCFPKVDLGAEIAALEARDEERRRKEEKRAKKARSEKAAQES